MKIAKHSESEKQSFIIITENNFKKDTRKLQWSKDGEELIIEGEYFEIIKIEKLKDKKLKVYVVSDEKENEMHREYASIYNKEFQKKNKQNGSNIIIDLLKQKYITKEFKLSCNLTVFNTRFAFKESLPTDGYKTSIAQPPEIL